MNSFHRVVLSLLAVLACAIGASAASAADLPATPANLQTVYNGASGGDNVILASGAYDWFQGTTKSSTVTLKPATGATVTMDGAAFNGSSNTNITGVKFTNPICVYGVSTNIDFDGIEMANVGSGCAEGRLSYLNGSTGTVRNSTFHGEPSCSSQSDGIFLGGGGGSWPSVSIINNEFYDLVQQDGCPHVDAVQYYGGSSPRVEDNYSHGNSTGFEGYDSNGQIDVFKNNVTVVYGTYITTVGASSNTNGSFTHNVLANGGRLDLGPKPGSGNPNPSGNTVKDNITPQINVPGTNTVTNNIGEGGVVYVGGTGRCAYALAAGSAGKNAATDGTDIGLNDCSGGGGPDTTAPDTTITSAPADGTSTSASISFTGSDNVGVDHYECKLDAGAYATCTSPKTYSGLAVGGHVFSVRAYDAAGNVDASPATASWTISSGGTDHTPVAAFTNTPNPSTVGQTVTFDASTSTCEDTPCTYHWHDVTSTGTGDWPLGPDGVTSTFAFQGTHPSTDPVYAELVLTDADGDVSKITHTQVVNAATQDTTPPDTTITSAPSDGTSTSASVSFTGTDNVGVDHYECKLDAGAYATCTSPKSYTGLSVGSHTVSVRAYDAAGNVDASPATATWTVQAPPDTTPPDTTITSAPSNGTSTSASISFTGTDNVGVDHFDCQLDGGTYALCTSPKTYSGLAVGSHTFNVKAVDAAGNSDPSAATATWTISAPANVTPPTFVNEYETTWTSGVTSKSVTVATSAGDVLVAYAGSEDTPAPVSISGSGLTWTLKQSYTTQAPAYVWTATVASGGNKTVTFSESGGTGMNWGADVLRFSGSTGVGASAKAQAQSVSLTTTKDNSAVVKFVTDWNAVSGAARNSLTTGVGAFTEKSYAFVSGRYTIYGGYHANVGAIGSKTVGYDAPTGMAANTLAVEVKGT